MERRVPQVAALAAPERLRLRDLAGRFLARKAISGAGGLRAG
ncbi:MAG: hypothetical protein RML12_02185 [Xanthomonadales bacterium]|nr:hypothetical protein [Xanthomonadales bacterium]